nr:MAG TPA: hypothetical protein [Caudoviricetes sp.]
MTNKYYCGIILHIERVRGFQQSLYYVKYREGKYARTIQVPCGFYLE